VLGAIVLSEMFLIFFLRRYESSNKETVRLAVMASFFGTNYANNQLVGNITNDHVFHII
jgi:hypothetical protein